MCHEAQQKIPMIGNDKCSFNFDNQVKNFYFLQVQIINNINDMWIEKNNFAPIELN